MNALTKRILMSVLLLVMVLGIAALATTTDTFAKGKPGAKCPWGPSTITLPDGTVCTLESCGSDCVYNCPIPVP